jgi:hypothetical protein
MTLSADSDIQYAKEAYVHGSLTLMNMHPDTYGKLRALLPALDSPLSYAGDEAETGLLSGPILAGEPLDLDTS